jgi:hypothetical protein
MELLTSDEWTRLAADLAGLVVAPESIISIQTIRRHLGTSDPVVLHNVIVTLEFDYPHLQVTR